MPNTVTTAAAARKLTIKQRRFIEHYLEHGNATDAAMYAYDCNNRVTAGALGYETLKKLQIDELMEAAGISDQKLLTVLAQGLAATKAVGAQIVVKKPYATSQADGELPPAEGRTSDFIEVEDYPTRHKYLETALKLKKRLGSDAPSVPIQNNIIIADKRKEYELE